MEKIRVKVFSYDYRLLEESVKTIMAQLSHKGIVITGPIILPTKRKLYTVLRSPHADKKSREQFETKIHKRMIEIKDPTKEVMNILRDISLPAGIDITVKDLSQ
ncbi:MAG: 30S ribosomal protein S10 [Elusimicrobiota bacterium]|nr:30S ribosomal protein S10 [Elusimicrobiota bacterium]